MTAIVDNDDHWMPYDEDDNYSIDSSDNDNPFNIWRKENDFILSTCIVNAQYNSIEIHGADLNAKIIHQLFEQIYHRLLQITSANNTNKHNKHVSVNDEQELDVFDISSSLSELKQTLTSFRLVYVAMTNKTLSLLLNIIQLSKYTLTDVQMELLIPVKNNINNEFDKLKIIGLFNRIMTQCSILPTLQSIGIDLINFPLDCYEYFSYFNPFNTFQSLTTLRIFICKENIKNETNIENLLNFIEKHLNLDAVRIIINDIEDDGIWDELLSIPVNSERYKDLDMSRFQLFEGDVNKFNKICFSIINSLNISQIRCKTLKAFSFCHYLSGDISQYIDILSLFVQKHCYLSEINIVFNSISDLYLSKLLNTIHSTNELMNNLEYIHIEFTKLDEFEFSAEGSFGLACEEFKEKNNEKFKSDAKFKHKTNKNIKQLHFGKQSVLELAILISKCVTLINLEFQCYFGVDLTAFQTLIKSIISHNNLNKIRINNLQRRNIIFAGLSDIFRLKKYSFIATLSIVFNRHYLDALRRDKYTIPDSFYQSLNNSSNDLSNSNSNEMENDCADEREKQLRPNCDLDVVYQFVDSIFESQINLLRYIEQLKANLSAKLFKNLNCCFPNDIIDIIIDYIVYNYNDNQENILFIALQSLPNDFKSKLKQYFLESYKEKQITWENKVNRIVQLNKASIANTNIIVEDDNINEVD